MVSFLCDFRPRSVNAKSTTAYKDAILTSLARYAGDTELLNGYLYGIAYYFHRRPTELDADNMSKPIWDALTQALYEDDRSVKLRYAGVFQIADSASVNVLDISRVPSDVLTDFLAMLDERDHILYIEIGALKPDHYVMGME
jgi:hypothetical protein